MAMSKGSLAVTIVSVLLAIAFFPAGGMKLISGAQAVEGFADYGYPGWFAYVTGALEVTGALLVLIPKTRFYGAVLLACIMAGAVMTHLKAGEAGMLGPPLLLLILSSIVAWARCPWIRGRKQAASSTGQP